MSTSVVSFNFVAQSVRIVMINDDPWFVAADVCAALSCNTEQTRRLDDDEKGLHTVQTPGGNQEVTIINESGLYSLILTSRKPEAKKFKKWSTSEVLPAIRKTGRYEIPEAPRPGIPDVQWQEVLNLIRSISRCCHFEQKAARPGSVDAICSGVNHWESFARYSAICCSTFSVVTSSSISRCIAPK